VTVSLVFVKTKGEKKERLERSTSILIRGSIKNDNTHVKKPDHRDLKKKEINWGRKRGGRNGRELTRKIPSDLGKFGPFPWKRPC